MISGRVLQSVWTKTVANHGFSQIAEGLLTEDPFDMLAKRAAQGEAGGQPSGRVTLSLSNAGEYGSPKVNISVTIPIVCAEGDISLAGEAAYIKVHQMVNEASASLQLPLLP